MHPHHQKKIEDLTKSAKIFVFMKGEKQQPMCGFSASVVEMLNELEAEYETFDVLQDQEIRQAIKEYTAWPTIPQIFIDSKFIGGADILQELYESGELQKMIGEKKTSSTKNSRKKK